MDSAHHANLFSHRDTDPDGVQLAATADPLGEAAKLLRRLREHAGGKLEVQQLSFEASAVGWAGRWAGQGFPEWQRRWGLGSCRSMHAAAVLTRSGCMRLTPLPPPNPPNPTTHTHTHAVQVYLRQGKLLLAVQAAKKAQQLAGAADPSVHSMVARLAAALLAAAAAPAAQAAEADAGGNGAALPPLAVEVAQQEAAQLLCATELSAAAAEAYRQKWAAAHAGSSLRHAAAAAEVAPPEARAAAVQQLQQVGPAGASHADCVAVAELLAGPLAAPEAASAWRQQCAARFPWSAVFGGASRLDVPAPWEAEASAAEGKGDEAANANGLVPKAAALSLS